MVLTQLITPDRPLGKMLVLLRALVQAAWLGTLKHDSHFALYRKLIFTVTPKHTMLSPVRLLNLCRLARRIEERNVAGAIVECGVWNGGSAAVMASAAANLTHRMLILCDSFNGLPPPAKEDGSKAARAYRRGWLKGDKRSVHTLFADLKIPMEKVVFIEGMFQDTLPEAEVEPLALLHIDADWYESVKTALIHLYPRLLPGGYLVLDDYGRWEGCRRAFDEVLGDRTGKELVGVNRCGSALTLQKGGGDDR